MPIPIIIGLIVAAVTVTAVVLNWDKIVIWWSGKQLAILGPRASGKSTLHAFLSTGTLPESYKPTGPGKRTRGRRFNLRDLDLRIKQSRDVGGSQDFYSVWKEIYDEADVVLYVVRADLLLKGYQPTVERVRKDMRHIGRWLQDARKPFFVIGTHMDKVDGFDDGDEDRIEEHTDQFRELDAVRELRRRAGGQGHVVLGSLGSTRSTEFVVFQVFSLVS